MASISSYDSNSISILLSSLPGSSQKQSASSSLLSSIKLTDYTAIRTGSFGKLMKAYYAKVESELDEDSDSSKDRLSNLSTSLSGDSSRTLTRIKENTSHLNDSGTFRTQFSGSCYECICKPSRRSKGESGRQFEWLN